MALHVVKSGSHCMLTHGLLQLHWLLLRRCRNSRNLQHLRRASLDVPRTTW